MISIIHQGSHRYGIRRDHQDIGCVTVSTNPYHNQHLYLNLELEQYDAAMAKELFSLLRKELGRPLQVMLSSGENRHDFLTAGGFVRRRRCYALEVSASDLIAPHHPSVELHTVTRGADQYTACCALLYAYYRKTHAAVSPLTVSQDVFCTDLPETVMCCIPDGEPIHYAFVEQDAAGYEIAYAGTAEPTSFSDFAQTLVHDLFQKGGRITMECDDCDPAAMCVRSLFRTSPNVSVNPSSVRS